MLWVLVLNDCEKENVYICHYGESAEIGRVETFFFTLFSLAIRCADFFRQITGFEFTLSLKWSTAGNFCFKNGVHI